VVEVAWGDYPLIRAYGKFMKQPASYIHAVQDRARADKAPQDVVHWFEGRWFRADDIGDPRTRAALGLPPLPKE
jgi:hypothetical protein